MLQIGPDELAHYGVLGMKWGVRKDDKTFLERRQLELELEYGKTNSPDKARKLAAGRIKLEKALVISGAVVIAGTVAYLTTSKLTKELKPVKLDPGSVLQNVNNAGDDLELDRMLFATFKDADNKKYRSQFAEELRERTGNGGRDIYATLLKNQTAIRAPSRKQTLDLFKEWQTEKGWGGEPVNIRNFQRNLMISKNPTGPGSFLDYLSRRGYNAMQDTLDTQNSFKSDTPLLIFNGLDTVTKQGSEIVSKFTK